MTLDRAFYSKVIELCYEKLEEAGFDRYRKKNADLPLHDGFHAWLGLNEGCDEDFIEINPFVGIHVVQIERLWKSLVNEQYRRSIATYAVHMGELVPNELSFRFFSDSDITSEARRLASLYKAVGISYANSIASYTALLPMLNSRIDTLGAYPERFACCLYLMGRNEDACSFVKSFNEKESEYFGQFAPKFLELVSN